MGSDSSPITVGKARRRRLRFLWIRIRSLLPGPLLGLCAVAAVIVAFRSVQLLLHEPSATEYMVHQQLEKSKEARPSSHRSDDGVLSIRHVADLASSQSFPSASQVAAADRSSHEATASLSNGRGNSGTPNPEDRKSIGDTGSTSTHAHNHKHKTQVLTRDLRWTIFPLLSRVITEASEAMAGGDGGERERDRDKERERREDLVRKIERWSNKPSSLCFGHGNLTIVTVTVDLPQEYVIHMRKNRLHYCALVHNCRYCDVPVNLDFSRPVAWTKVKAMQLALAFSETVVHMDADALIVNASISFPSLISSLSTTYNTSQKDVVYTTDFQFGRTAEPGTYSLINTGVYIMHSTNWTRAFLEVQYRLYQSSIFHKFWDQQAVMLYRMKHRHEFYEHVALIPYRYMNVPCSHKYNDYVPGDFIVHYAGGHNLQKYERLSKMFLETHET